LVAYITTYLISLIVNIFHLINGLVGLISISKPRSESIWLIVTPSLDIINYHGGFYSLTLYNKGSKNFKDHIFEILDQSSHSVVITDIHQEDNPIIFVNNRFTELFGYTQKEVLGKNCRFLQGNDKEQKEIAQIREAIDKQEEIAVTLRNYDKYGKLILNEIHIAK